MLPYVAIAHPEFVPAADATFLVDDDILIGVARGTVAKAYPAADLAQHGSVDDEMADGPIEVTWCGVCNTGAVFRAEIGGRRLHFDYDSMVGANEVHKDRETGSRWQQSTGEAISGPLKGKTLALYPFVRTTWKEWRRRFPDTLVLRPMPGYAENMPRISTRIKQTRLSDFGAPKAAFGRDNRLPPREIVAGLQVGQASKAYPFSVLRDVRVANDRIGSTAVLIVHQPSSDTTTAFDPRVKGRVLRFEAKDADASSLSDTTTHSTWDAYGLALAGPLQGTQLNPLILVPEFWFAWSEFHPRTAVFAISRAPAGAPAWETLKRAPVPAETGPNIALVSLSPRATAGTLGNGHTHPGPVFGYILRGAVENQVQPEPPAVYRTGEVFFETPGRLHVVMRSVDEAEPATVLAFLGGAASGGNAAVTFLAEAPLAVTANQEAILRRLGLPGGARAEIAPSLNPGVIYILDGRVEIAEATNQATAHAAGDVLVQMPNQRLNLHNSGSARAKILVFQVRDAKP